MGNAVEVLEQEMTEKEGKSECEGRGINWILNQAG